MKRILFIMPDLTGGGAEKVLIDILNNIDYSKYKVDLFLEYKIGFYINRIPAQVKVINLYKTYGLYDRIKWKLLAITNITAFYDRCYTSYRLRRLIGNKYDTIISFLEGKALRIHREILNKAVKNVTWVHTDLFSNHWTLKGYNMSLSEEECLYKSIDTIVFVSKQAQESLEKLYNVETDKIVLYNPIDRDYILKYSEIVGVEKRKFTICTVGRLVSQKRFDRLIRVSKMLVADGFDFDVWIIGDGTLKSDLMNMVSDFGLNNVVHFLGFVSPPYSYIKISDVFISTSEAEGFSLVVAEALCLGKTIVSTKTTGPVELLGNGKYGILVDEEDNSIYNALKMLLTNTEILKAYNNKASIRGEEISNINCFMKQFYDIID